MKLLFLPLILIAGYILTIPREMVVYGAPVVKAEPVVILAEVTAYSPYETCDGECIMANGKNPIEGESIACPREIKLGTKVSIDGREFICSDRTNKRFNGRWDIFMEDYQDALKFGRQKKHITLLAQNN